jgi:hypothetical protein
MSFKRRLKNRCAILQPTVGSADEWNNTTITFVAPSTPVDLRSVPCFFYPGIGQEMSDAQRTASVDRAFFDFEKDIPISNADRIEFNDQVYEVIQVSPVGGGHHLLIETQQVQI